MQEKVHKQILDNAQRIENKYNAAKKIKILAYKVGDVVIMKIPTLDRGLLDLREFQESL